MAILSLSDAPAFCSRLEYMTQPNLMRLGLDGQGLEPTAAEVLLGITAGEIARQALCLATKGCVELPFSFIAETNDVQAWTLGTDLGVVQGVGFVREVACELFVRSTTTLAAKRYARALLIGAATDVVNSQSNTDTGATANIREFGNGTPLTDPTLAFAASGADVTLTYTGDSGVDTRVLGKIMVYPQIALALI